MNTRAASYKGPMFVNEAISNREAINKRAASSYNEAMFVNEAISDSVALNQNSGIHIISKPSYEIMKNRELFSPDPSILTTSSILPYSSCTLPEYSDSSLPPPPYFILDPPPQYDTIKGYVLEESERDQSAPPTHQHRLIVVLVLIIMLLISLCTGLAWKNVELLTSSKINNVNTFNQVHQVPL